MSVVNIEMPEEMVSFVLPANKEEQLKRNAMMLYPYVHDGIISSAVLQPFVLFVHQSITNLLSVRHT